VGGRLVRPAGVLVAAAFVLIGILGLVPGIMTHYGELAFAGSGSRAQLFGIFRVSVLLDLVHLCFGVAGLVLVRSAETARVYLTGGGAASLALWLLGVVAAGRWVPLDSADNWLHFLLGVAMLGLAHVASRGGARAATA
jgi:hypothetical protein